MIHFFSENNLSFPGAILKVMPWESETVWDKEPRCNGLIEGFSETPEGENPLGDVHHGEYGFKIIPASEVSMTTAIVAKLTPGNDYLPIDNVECNNLRNWISQRKIPVNNGYRFSHDQSTYMFCEHQAPFVSEHGSVGCYLQAVEAINQSLQLEYDRLCNEYKTLQDDQSKISSDESMFVELVQTLQIKQKELNSLLDEIEADVTSWHPEQTNGIEAALNSCSYRIHKLIRNWVTEDETAWPEYLKSLTDVLSEFTKELSTAWKNKPDVKEPDVSEEQNKAPVEPDSSKKFDDLPGPGSPLDDDEDDNDD